MNVPIHALVIENNPASANIAGLLLEKSGLEHDLNVVPNGNRAIAFLDQINPFEHAPRPDLILLGLRLPEIDAVAVLTEIAHIRAAWWRSSAAVIVLFELDDPTSREAARVLGADAYFIKPTSFEELQSLAADLRHLWDRLKRGPVLEPPTPCSRELL